MGQVDVKARITVEDQASAALAGFGNSFKSLGSMAVTSLKAAALAIVAVGTAATVFAVKSAADFEQTRIGLENMLGSADKARVLLGQISKFAAETPFEFPELAQATRQLVAFGFSAEDAFNTMKNLGDVSAAVGAPINDLAYLMGTLRAQGRAFTIDIRQFAMRGIPIYEYLAKVLNTDTQALTGMIEQGKVGFPEVQKAFQLMTAAGGAFHGTMEKQSRSLSGLWSTLKDNIGAAGREIIGISTSGDIRENSIFDILRKGAMQLIEFLDKNQTKIVASAQKIVGGMQVLVTGNFSKGLLGPEVVEDSAIVVKILRVREAFVGLFGLVKGVGTVTIASLQSAFNFLKPTLMELWKALATNLIPALTRLWKEVIVPLLPVIGALLVGAVWALIKVLTIMVNNFSGLLNFGLNVVKFFTTDLPNAITGAAYALTNAFTETVSTLGNIWNQFTTFARMIFTTVFNTIVAALTQFKDHFLEDIGFAIGFILTLPIKLLGAFIYMSVTAMQIVGQWLGNMGTAIFVWGGGVIKYLFSINWGAVFMGIVNAIGGALGASWNAIVGTFTGIIKWVSNINWGAVAASMGNAFVGILKGVEDSVTRVFRYITGLNWGAIVGGVGKGIANAIIDLINGAIRGAFSGVPGLKDHVPQIPRFAAGVQNFAGGLAVVGEKGPELAYLPRGSNVLPAGTWENTGSTNSITINVTFSGVFTNNESEMRQLAMRVFSSAKDAAGAKNMSLSDLVRAK